MDKLYATTEKKGNASRAEVRIGLCCHCIPVFADCGVQCPAFTVKYCLGMPLMNSFHHFINCLCIHGEVRVKEMKQMIKTLHDNNINVIMDVVYSSEIPEFSLIEKSLTCNSYMMESV